MEKMDAAFQQAMQAAVADGNERCATMPCARAGTKRPITGYQRGD